jgi:predicted anti-sigma-YlaC factor YlaD
MEKENGLADKMLLAAETHDVYLSLMTAASCRHFYDEMADQFIMERIPLMQHIRSDDMRSAAEAFDRAMESYRRHYDRLGAEVVRYPDLEAFERVYLGEMAAIDGSVR